ncbi:MAG TPA: hypothetical protein VF208_12325 [Candidatus Binatia bacterium]
MTVIAYETGMACEGVSRRMVKRGMKLTLPALPRLILNFRSRICGIWRGQESASLDLRAVIQI